MSRSFPSFLLGMLLTSAIPCAVGAEDKPRTDAHGDPLPTGAVSRIGSIRWQATGFVSQVAFSPDGKTLAAAGNDGTIRLWEIANGKVAQTLKTRSPFLTLLVFSADSKRLAASGSDGPVTVFDVARGAEVKRFGRAKGNDSPGMALSADGKLLAVGDDRTVKLWDVDAGRELKSLTGHTGAILALALTEDSKQIVSAGFDATVRVWDVEAGKEARSFKVPGPRVVPTTTPTGNPEQYRLAFSPGGKHLAVAAQGTGEDLSIWDVEKGEAIRRQRWQAGIGPGMLQPLLPGGFALSGDGRFVLIGLRFARDWYIYGVASGKVLRTLDRRNTAGQTMSVAFSPDGNLVAGGNGNDGLFLWDVANDRDARAGEGHVGAYSAAFMPDGKRIVTRGTDGAACLWDAATGKQLARVEDARLKPTGGISVSDDGKTVTFSTIAGPGVLRWQPDRDGNAVQQVGSGRVLASPNGSLHAVVEMAGKIRLLNAETGKETASVDTGLRNVINLTFSPDGGRLLFTDGADPRIRVWAPATGPDLRILPGVLGPISNDGKLMLRPARGGATGVWLTEIASSRDRFLVGKNQNWAVAIPSPDGLRLAAATPTGEVALLDVATGEEITRFKGHTGAVTSLGFSPDGKRLASTSRDSTTLVWDLAPYPAKLPRGRKLSAKELESLWSELGGAEGNKVHEAIWTLVAGRGQSEAFLGEKLQGVKSADPETIARLIKNLDADEFADRQKASEDLEKLGGEVVSHLKKALENKPSAEAKRRLEDLLDKLQGGGESMERARVTRAIEVLEYAATAEAKTVLESLAKGPAGAWTTGEAKAALDRLVKRQ